MDVVKSTTDNDAPKDKYTPQSAGLLRALARTLIQRSAHFPSVAPRTVGTISDYMGTALDAYEIVSRANRDGKSQPTKVHKVIQVLKGATPTLLQSIILGTVLFTVYDKLTLLFGLEESKKIGSSSGENWTRVIEISAVSGGLSGMTNGILYYLWNRAICKYPNPLGSAVVAHGMVHCSLFTSFEFSKRYLMEIMDVGYTDYLGVLAIAIAGAISGSVQELVSHYSETLEVNGINRSSLRSVQKLPPPSLWKLISPSVVLPTAIGFLAYEYGKDLLRIESGKT